MFHRLAASGPSYNLPGWMVSDEIIAYLYQKRSMDTDFDIIEGVMGYFDGHTTDAILGSSAHLAETIDADVLVIMDGSGMALTAAAIVNGLVSFHTPSRIKGVVFNKIKSPYHYQLLKEAVEKHTGIKCYGYLCPDEDVILESRHLGLVQAQETYKIEDKIQKMANLVEATVDVEGILKAFKKKVDQKDAIGYDKRGMITNPLDAKLDLLSKEAKDLVIGYAHDLAFSFYYDENLATLRELGVTLIPFSPMYDTHLPTGCHGLYLGGGYPEVFAKILSSNLTMLRDIHSFGKAGRPIYAECGGYMYLTTAITTIEGKEYPMVDLFKAKAIMTDRLQHFGHVVSTITGLAESDIVYRGHEFHHSVVETQSDAPKFLISVQRRDQNWPCGLYVNRTLGTYVHAHFYSNLELLDVLIKFWKS